MTKGYSLIKENKDHFLIHHPKEGAFKVAKSGLDKKAIAKVKAMPMCSGGMAYNKGGVAHYDDGGEVNEGDDAVAPAEQAGPSDSGIFEGVKNWVTGATGPGGPGNSLLGSLGSKIADTAKDVYSYKNPSANRTAPAEQVGPPASEAPRNNPNVAQTGGQGGMQTTGYDAQTGKITPNFDPYAGMNMTGMDQSQTVKTMQDAMTQQSDASQKMADAAIEQQAQASKDGNYYDNEFQKLNSDTDQLKQAVMNGKIDPNRVWNNASTGNKVMATIGMLLSGIGSGLTGQPNMAMKVIDDTINRDIESQKADLGKKQTLLSMNMQKYGNLHQAQMATMAQMHATYEAQIQSAIGQSNNAQAQMHGAAAIQQMQNQQLQWNMQLANMRTQNYVMNGGTGVAGMSPMALNNAFGDKWTKLPDGNVGVAYSTKDAEAVREAASSHAEMNSLIARMKDLNTRAGQTGAWTPALKQEAQDLKTQALPAVLHSDGFKRLSKEDVEFFSKSTPDLGSTNFGGVNQSIKDYETALNDKMNGVYGAHLINYNRGANARRDQGF